MISACDECLRRPWLLRELAGHLDPVRADITEVLALPDEHLLAAVGGRRSEDLGARLHAFDAPGARREAERAGMDVICRCDPAYPARLRDLGSAPAVLHVVGGLEPLLATSVAEPVAIVGSRAASSYGTSVAHALARGLASAGVPVVSGMALGIDAAAHDGALSVGGPTVAVLPGPAHQAYPRAASRRYRQLRAVGATISEIPPGTTVRRWMFLARNRIIAGLAAMTIVVEAGERSAALLTARHAQSLERPVGAVPGRVTTPQAAGPNQLIREGAQCVGSAQDVLDLLFEAGTRTAPTEHRPELTPELRSLLGAIEDGHDTTAALLRHGVVGDEALVALASLELAGYVRCGPGGRFTLIP